jgi:hypothetical protein
MEYRGMIVIQDSFGAGLGKRQASWKFDALDVLPNKEELQDQYWVSIEKMGSYWIVFAENHEPKDMVFFDDSSCKEIPNKFKSLRAALDCAIPWANDFYDCFIENVKNGEADCHPQNKEFILKHH